MHRRILNAYLWGATLICVFVIIIKPVFYVEHYPKILFIRFFCVHQIDQPFKLTYVIYLVNKVSEKNH